LKSPNPHALEQGKLIGAKTAATQTRLSIRTKLQIEGALAILAMFNLAIDSNFAL